MLHKTANGVWVVSGHMAQGAVPYVQARAGAGTLKPELQNQAKVSGHWYQMSDSPFPLLLKSMACGCNLLQQADWMGAQPHGAEML